MELKQIINSMTLNIYLYYYIVCPFQFAEKSETNSCVSVTQQQYPFQQRGYS